MLTPDEIIDDFRTYLSPKILKIGENCVRTQMMLGRGLNLQAGYIFKSLVSIDARYTSLRPDDFSFLK